ELLVFEDPACQPLRACVDDDAAWFRQGLQPGREVRRLAYDTTFVSFAGTDKITHDDNARRNADAHLQSPARRSRYQPRSLHNLQTGANRPLGIVLMRLRVAEVSQYPVAHIFGDKAIE